MNQPIDWNAPSRKVGDLYRQGHCRHCLIPIFGDEPREVHECQWCLAHPAQADDGDLFAGGRT